MKEKEKEEQPLVSLAQLEQLIDSQKGLEAFREFLKNRWLAMVIWWHGRSEKARRKYFLLRAVVIVGGVLVPVLAAFGAQTGWEKFSAMTTACLGAVLAGCAAWEGVANYGEIWREKRRASELLKVEGWQFFQRCKKYQNDGTFEKAFPRFAAEVEAMIAKEVGEYLSVFDRSLDQVDKLAAAIADAIIEKVKKQL